MPSEEYPPGLDNIFLYLEQGGEDVFLEDFPLGDILAARFFMETLFFSEGQIPLFFMN